MMKDTLTSAEAIDSHGNTTDVGLPGHLLERPARPAALARGATCYLTSKINALWAQDDGLRTGLTPCGPTQTVRRRA